MSKRGLPTGIKMRHDSHYVEELAGNRSAPVGKYIPVELLDPNPEQPRVEIGDLSELTDSIRDKGVLEPLLVRPARVTGRWMIIAGERRWRAARAAGLREVPCIEMDVDDGAVAEIALIENMQRKDLTAWEEADGLAALCLRFGYTHEDVARRVGKSRTTVTEALSIAGIPDEIREVCRHADIQSKSLILQIVRQPDLEAMKRMVREISSKGLKRDDARAVRRAQTFSENPELPKTYIYKHQLQGEGIKLELKFKKGDISPDEIIEALQLIIKDLLESSQSGVSANKEVSDVVNGGSKL